MLYDVVDLNDGRRMINELQENSATIFDIQCTHLHTLTHTHCIEYARDAIKLFSQYSMYSMHVYLSYLSIANGYFPVM